MKEFLYISIFFVIAGEFKVNCEKKFELNRVNRGNWFRAYHFCKTHAMQLARISSEEENNRLVNQMRGSGIIGDFWIGATNLGFDGVFYWMGHEEEVTFTDWETGEPRNSNDGENCVRIRRDLGYKWDADSCYLKKFFVCEKDE